MRKIVKEVGTNNFTQRQIEGKVAKEKMDVAHVPVNITCVSLL